MMDTVNINVKIPALGDTYEFIVPQNMPVSDVQFLMIKILNVEYGLSEDIANCVLFDIKDNKSLKWEYTFSQLGITDGANLILV